MDSSELRCIICTKQPTFCDLSHLLTHLASKAHLASHFGLQVRTKDAGAAELLKTYDDWYTANDLGSLLSVRLAAKEQRKKRKSEDTTFNTQATKKRETTEGPISLSAPVAVAASDCLDPRLAGSHTDNREEEFQSPVTPSPWAAVNSDQKAPTGRILRSMRSPKEKKTEDSKLENGFALDNSKLPVYPVTPTKPQQKKDTGIATWASSQDTPDQIVDSVRPTQTSGKPKRDRVTGTRADEIARLKGVIWPGMDCFDAATEEMRRLRNQKKDGTVLKQMEIASMLVKPCEIIFSYTGEFLKDRVITGNVEEDSPLKGESPIPRHRQARAPVKLTNADPNVPLANDRKRQRVSAQKACKLIGDMSAKEGQSSYRRRMPGDKQTQSSFDGEFELSVNAFGKRARSRLNVFADDEDEASKQPYFSQDMNMGSKGQCDTLTPTRLLLDRKPAASANHRSMVARTAVDKENLEPTLNHHNRVGFGLGIQDWNSAFVKRHDTDCFGAQYLDESSFLGLGGTFNSKKNGYQSNPLFAPEASIYDNPFKQEHQANHNDWQSIVQAPASEETISEEEQLPYPGVY